MMRVLIALVGLIAGTILCIKLAHAFPPPWEQDPTWVWCDNACGIVDVPGGTDCAERKTVDCGPCVPIRVLDRWPELPRISDSYVDSEVFPADDDSTICPYGEWGLGCF